MKKVYTIVLYEKSPKEFKEYPDDYIHKFSQKSDTGIKLELLQEYVYIPLDVFQNVVQNKGIGNRLEAWLEFFSTDEPRRIAGLLKEYPEFKQMYQEIYELCQNVEKVMEMFSKELLQLDRNTVQYMIDEMQNEIDAQKGKISEQEQMIADLQKQIEQLKRERDEFER